MKKGFSGRSLDRLQFLLSHLEGFIGDEDQEIQRRAKEFVAAGDLEKIEKLVEGDPSDPGISLKVLEQLALFFDSGLMLQRESADWRITDLFWRGSAFNLEPADQMVANHLVPETAPLQIQRANAGRMLNTVKLEFIAPHADAEAYLLKPTLNLAYVLISNLAAPWSVGHVTHAQRLVNKCFLY